MRQPVEEHAPWAEYPGSGRCRWVSSLYEELSPRLANIKGFFRAAGISRSG